MKNKGFTLVELLAVILILGIISLIAIPVITNVIREAKENAVKRSAEQYVKAIEQKIVAEGLKGNTLYGEYSISDLDLDIKGTQPTAGTITIEDGNIIECSLKYKNMVYKCSDPSSFSSYDVDITFPNGKKFTCQNKGLRNLETVYFNPVTGTKCTKRDYENNLALYGQETGYIAGIPKGNYDYFEEVVDPTGLKTGCMKWYLIKDSLNNVDMILDHNTTATVAWDSIHSYGWYGPVTLLEQLHEDTDSWVGVPVRSDAYYYENDYLDYSIDYSGYHARIIEAQEIAKITGSRGWNDETADYSYYDYDVGYHEIYGDCIDKFDEYMDELYYEYYDEYDNPRINEDEIPDLDEYYDIFYSSVRPFYSELYDYTDSEIFNIRSLQTSGYWTSSIVNEHSSMAWRLYGPSLDGSYIDDNDIYGLRPVITVLKSAIK